MAVQDIDNQTSSVANNDNHFPNNEEKKKPPRIVKLRQYNVKTHPPLPDGTNLDDYARHETWSATRWTWEFLRRNTEFRRACDNLFRETSKFTEIEIAAQYGLHTFKHYRSKYPPFPKFKASTVKVYGKEGFLDSLENSTKTRVPIILSPGEVAVVFDLSASGKSKASFKAQVESLKKQLANPIKSIEEFNKIKGSKKQKSLFITYIRILDLRRTRSRTNLKILDISRLLLTDPKKKFRHTQKEFLEHWYTDTLGAAKTHALEYLHIATMRFPVEKKSKLTQINDATEVKSGE